MSVEKKQRAEGPAARFDDGVIPTGYRKGIYGFLTILAAYVIVRGIVGAAGNPLRYDELLTLTIAEQPI